MGWPARFRFTGGKRTRQWLLIYASNAWNLNGGSWNNNNKTNTNNYVVPFFDTLEDAIPGCFLIIMEEYVTYGDIHKAYLSCRKHKRNKPFALAYEMNYEVNNLDLLDDLNSGTYEIGPSLAFCVTRPKIREIFCASFRDRIVHHLVIGKMLPIFEADMIQNSYSCRSGRGGLYGVRDIERQVKKIGKDCWCLRLDIKAYFNSIDKNILWGKVDSLIRKEWKEKDVDWWLGLLKKIIFHRPEKNCKRQGDLTLWDYLPKEKSLFYSDGLPIGNLPSQILANLYLSDFDKWVSSQVEGYGRYADDICVLDSDKNKLLNIIPSVREYLSALNLVLNETKTVLQRADKGILFTGYIIQPWGVYAGKRLTRNAIKASKIKEDKKKHVFRLNSYLGFLRHTLSYGIRYSMLNNTIPEYNYYATTHIYSFKAKK